VEERVADIELMNRPSARGGEMQNSAHRCRLDDGTKSLAKVDADTLREAVHDPSGHVTIEGAVRVDFVAEHPLACDDVDAAWTRYKRPCPVLLQGSKLGV
jgi:aconitase A